jgi:hypothetical protein
METGLLVGESIAEWSADFHLSHLSDFLRPRLAIRRDVKFVEVPGLPNKRGWQVGDETWINVSHPQMQMVYDALQLESVPTMAIDIARVLFDLLSYRFEDALVQTTRLVAHASQVQGDDY